MSGLLWCRALARRQRRTSGRTGPLWAGRIGTTGQTIMAQPFGPLPHFFVHPLKLGTLLRTQFIGNFSFHLFYATSGLSQRKCP